MATKMISIYALSTEVFKSEQDFIDCSPETEYFYVGRTKDIDQRKSQHASNARCGSDYPYHEKIRKLKNNWDIEELVRIEKDAVTDHEEYYIIKLTCEGHPLLNIKRGDSIRRSSKKLFNKIKEKNIKNSIDYANAMKTVRAEKIKQREFRQISKKLKHVRYDEVSETHYYDLEGQTHKTEKYVSKKELIEMLCPSVNKGLEKLMIKVEELNFR